MLLNSVETLRTRLNVADKPRTNNALKDILADVALALETHLYTKFGREEYSQTYYLNPSNYLTSGETVYLRLTGFAPTSVSVGLKSTLGSAPVAIPDEYISIDTDNGIASVTQYFQPEDYLTVTYTGGFELADDGETYQGVPLVLQRASLQYAEYVYLKKYGDEADEDGDDYTTPPQGVIQMLSRYERYAQHALRPIK